MLVCPGGLVNTECTRDERVSVCVFASEHQTGVAG